MAYLCDHDGVDLSEYLIRQETPGERVLRSTWYIFAIDPSANARDFRKELAVILAPSSPVDRL